MEDQPFSSFSLSTASSGTKTWTLQWSTTLQHHRSPITQRLHLVDSGFSPLHNFFSSTTVASFSSSSTTQHRPQNRWPPFFPPTPLSLCSKQRCALIHTHCLHDKQWRELINSYSRLTGWIRLKAGPTKVKRATNGPIYLCQSSLLGLDQPKYLYNIILKYILKKPKTFQLIILKYIYFWQVF